MTTTAASASPLVLSVEGELVVGNRQEFKQRILDAITDGQRRFVIDFTDAHYVDASGLGVLVSIQKHVRAAGGSVMLAGLNEDLVILFELTRLTTVFQIADTLERALEVRR